METLLDLKKIERISKALGDLYRLQMMQIISDEKEWMQCQKIIGIFNLSQSTVSHHLKQLVDAELLIAEKNGRHAKYIINEEVCNAYASFVNGLRFTAV